ncbi:hypothetical protein BC835DRAFT_874035 [Cytidiella melzeri]|nr:hypothetical protein BC835DRAFT_874035 [Cytidiella melzeri]
MHDKHVSIRCAPRHGGNRFVIGVKIRGVRLSVRIIICCPPNTASMNTSSFAAEHIRSLRNKIPPDRIFPQFIKTSGGSAPGNISVMLPVTMRRVRSAMEHVGNSRHCLHLCWNPKQAGGLEPLSSYYSQRKFKLGPFLHHVGQPQWAPPKKLSVTSDNDSRRRSASQ